MNATREDEVALNRAKYGGRTAQRQAPVSPAPPRIPRITRLMALAIRFQDMVDRSEIRDYAEVARLGFVTRARLTQIMNLCLLAPDIQERILDMGEVGRDVAVQERQVRPLAIEPLWAAQRKRFRRVRCPDADGRA